MKLEKRFNDIQSFLRQHQYLHECEVLLRYPNQQAPYHNWAKSVLALPTDQRRQHENGSLMLENFPTDYQDFLAQIKELQLLPKQNYSEQKIPQILKRKMTEKKQHELSVINQQFQKLNCEHFIDIGSGAGHLSSYLLWQNKKTSECIDLNAQFQEIGKKKFKRDLPELLERLTFTHAQFSKQTPLKETKNMALIGLHACGDLSVEILQSFTQNQIAAVLNYGCCYHKLNSSNINISQRAKLNPLILTNHSLTLAAKSYKAKTDHELDFRDKVKSYRYSLHILLQDQLQKEFITLGNATASDYAKPFAFYAKKYAPQFFKNYSDTELNAFYTASETQAKVDYLMCMGIIRSKIARLVEIFLILDRALYLVENGMQVELEETFDPQLSPRNISLLACRNH